MFIQIFIIFNLIFPIILIVGCTVWGLVQKKAVSFMADDRKRILAAGFYFGLFTIALEVLSDYGRTQYSPDYVVGGIGIVPVCAGMFFGGEAGLISAVFGVLYEIVYFFIHDRAFEQISDGLVTLLLGIAVWYISKYVIKKHRAPLSLCIMFSLAVSALNVVSYPVVSIFASVSESLVQLSPVAIWPMYFGNMIGIIVTFFIIQKINNISRTKAPKKTKSSTDRITRTVGIALFVTLSMAVFVYVTAVCRNQTAMVMEAKLDAEEKIVNDLVLTSKENSIQHLDYFSDYSIIMDTEGNIISRHDKRIETILEDIPTLTADGLENLLLIRKFPNEERFVMFRRSGDYVLINTMSLSDGYLYRMPLFLLIVSVGIIIIFTLNILIGVMIDRDLIVREENIKDTLTKAMGSNPDYVEDVEYNLSGSGVTHYLEKIVERIADELKFAGDIQMQSLPMGFTSNMGVALNALVKPARDVGGDFYDYFMLDGNRMAFLIADVSGKGISGAMFMMRAKAAIRAMASREDSEVLSKANDILCEGNADVMFVAAWMGVIDTMTGRVQYVNAGLGNRIYRANGGEYVMNEDAPEAPLGIVKGKKYEIRELQMYPGDRIFLYTDGVTDASNESGQMYGDDRILEYLNENLKTANGDETVTTCKEELKAYMGNEEQFDDITIMAVDYFGRWTDFNFTFWVFKAIDENLDMVLDFVNTAIEPLGCSEGQIMEIDVAMEEIFTNVSHYAYQSMPGDVAIEVSVDYGMVTIQVSDNGVMFNPLRHKDPDNNVPLQDRKEGGLGLTMVKSCMNYLDYAYEDGRNILTMIKVIR